MNNHRRVIQSSHRFHGPCSACRDGDTALQYHTHDLLPKSYTLDDLTRLAAEWIVEQEGDTEMLKWTFSIFIEWARKQEKEVGDATSGMS